MSYENSLIYGKNRTQKIVSLEINGEHTELFIQQEDGSVKSEFFAHEYWMLSHKWKGPKFVPLEGNLYFKYMAKFQEKEEFDNIKYRIPKEERFIVHNAKEAAMVKNGYTYCKGLTPKDITVLSFDIETNGLKHKSDSTVYMISNTYRRKGEIVKKLFSFDEYSNCGEMLVAWCEWVRGLDPSWLVGHNVSCYDLPYLAHVASLEHVNLELGRDKSSLKFNDWESKFRIDGTRELTYFKPVIYGREVIDTLFLSYKYDAAKKAYESYGLKNIIKQEKLEKEGRVYYDAGEIRKNIHIPAELVKIKEYAKDDADDALALFDLMIPPYFYMGQSVPKPIQMMIESATGAMLNMLLVRSYIQIGYSIPMADEMGNYGGGYSNAIPGIYKNCVRFDSASHYPSIMRQYQIYNPKKDPKKHFLEVVEYFTLERLKNKKLAKETGIMYYKDMESAGKTMINSFYGALGTPGLNFNYLAGADEVTRRGRELLEKAIIWASGKTYNETFGIEKKKEEDEETI